VNRARRRVDPNPRAALCHANANFGEALYLWDVICRTRLEDVERAG
jgi:hypothetical protein